MHILLMLLGLVALFFIAKYVVQRNRRTYLLANWVAGALVVTFLAGAGTHEFLYKSEPPPPLAQTTPEPTPAPVPTMRPIHAPLTRAQVDSLTAIPPRKQPAGIIEALIVLGDEPKGDRFPSGSQIVVRGWAGDPGSKGSDRGLIIVVDGKGRNDASHGYGAERPDVAQAYKTPVMLHTGFEGIVDTGGLAPGRHVLELALVTPDGRHFMVVPSSRRAFSLLP